MDAICESDARRERLEPCEYPSRIHDHDLREYLAFAPRRLVGRQVWPASGGDGGRGLRGNFVVDQFASAHSAGLVLFGDYWRRGYWVRVWGVDGEFAEVGFPPGRAGGR